MAHLELGRLGEEIIRNIIEITDDGEQRSHSSIVGVLSQLFDKVLSFVEDALTARGPNDGVVYWAEQTYEAAQWIEKGSLCCRQVQLQLHQRRRWRQRRVHGPRSHRSLDLRKKREAGIVGVRKLPSGDVLVQVKDREGKQTLEGRRRWLERVAPSARIVKDMYPVLVHSVKISNIKTTNQKEAIKSLEAQNGALRAGLRIV
jgi:hypothetical protein